jgi:hypothetical protein
VENTSPPPALPDPTSPTLIVLPWLDPVVDAVGHDPRSPYVEHFWLGVLGPSTTWLLRRFATGFDSCPDGYELDLTETAAALGLATTGGRHNPFGRALRRCVQFGMAQPNPHGLSVRRLLPPLSARQVARLPGRLRAVHGEWLAPPPPGGTEYRARVLARSMLEVGDEPERVERQLHLVGVPVHVGTAALRWALDALTLQAPPPDDDHDGATTMLNDSAA